MADKEQILAEIEKLVKERCIDDATGHDWNHIDRVRRNSLKIAKKEGGDAFIIELAALLHDVEDWKTENYKSGIVAKWLDNYGTNKNDKQKIMNIIERISFKGTNHDDNMDSIEGKIVQDADRLDAIGAIGLARCIAFGTSKNRTLYDPSIEPDMGMKRNTTTINHFYEKLLLLKDRMNTKTAKELAKERHEFMDMFLKQFFREWNK
ncbi:MAG: HD domain-containing protein [Candidatus Aenigmarchaeota archaeon]|nr:HD domain-containing protein [Candidatus Aenigmarchaeota archaeon]